MVDLSYEQKQVIDLESGRVLVTARPGCGKTTAIAHRIARLTRIRSVGDTGVLCLTHSRAAVAAMTTYTETLIGRVAEPTVVATFHSFAESILRAYGHTIGIEKLTLLDTDEARATALRLALAEEGIEFGDEGNRALAAISAHLRRAVLAEANIELNGLSLEEVVRVYRTFLDSTQTVDFDVLLIKATELLASNPSIRSHYQRMYGHVIVDEAQDTSNLQLDLLAQLIAPKTRSVAIFMDPGQRVNGWLGVPEGVQGKLTEAFELELIELTMNFRNSNPILNLADAIRDRLPFVQNGGVAITQTSGDEEEAKHVVHWLQERLADPTIGSVAVLGRSAWLLTPTEKALDADAIAYWHPVDRNNLFSTPALRSLLPILRWISSPDNPVTQREVTQALALKGVVNLDTVSSTYAECYPAASWLAPVLAAPKGAALEGLESAANDQLVTGVYGADSESQALADDLQRLTDRLRTRRLRTAKTGTLDWTAVYQCLTEPRKRPAQSIWVGSIHAAKGLEFDAVAIVGLTEGGLPDFRSTTPAQINEERRLFYVAVTRARKQLLITHCAQRTAKSGKPYATAPSQLLQGIA